jgi:peptidoglycan/xylan/chitin deacetylase (PgdA/CDA1 family)
MLHIVMYHYVRDLPRTLYPRIKGMLLQDFERQVRELAETFEMAPLEAALAYLKGSYRPRRDMCLLTFDDGLKEHYREVTPVLSDLGIQGIFSAITACLEERVVVPVHMNHFLMAALDFDEYRRAFVDRLRELAPEAAAQVNSVSPELARKTYAWDTLEIAIFKYFFNFILDPVRRDSIVRVLFERYIGSEREFAEELYMSWSEARAMQAAGMLIGGHTHEHRPLSSLSDTGLESDLTRCAALLHKNLDRQALWPFCYPYGKSDSFQPAAIALLARLGFDCAFTTEKGPNQPDLNQPGANLFTMTRVDCKAAPEVRPPVCLGGAA